MFSKFELLRGYEFVKKWLAQLLSFKKLFEEFPPTDVYIVIMLTALVYRFPIFRSRLFTKATNCPHILFNRNDCHFSTIKIGSIGRGGSFTKVKISSNTFISFSIWIYSLITSDLYMKGRKKTLK